MLAPWEGSTTVPVMYTVVWRNSVFLIIRNKYGAVIGRETRFLVCGRYVPTYNFQAMGFFLANHSAVFNPDHQTTEFRQTTV
jgi:hypothetical protein